MSRQSRRMLGVIGAMGIVAGLLTGCARGGAVGPVVPQVLIDFTVRFAGPINDAYYYFIPIDTDGDLGQTGPVPVAAGPYWENGWGTGSFSHYILYNQGQYNVYKVNLAATLRTAGGGIVAASGTPQSTHVGTHQLTIQSIGLGAVSVIGPGMITGATNNSFQSASTLQLQTDGSGLIVAASVTYTPAVDGGRALTGSEQAAINALNAGGVPLASNSLAALGLTLTVGPAAAGTQTLAVGPTIASVQDLFTSATDGQQTTTTASLKANSATPTLTPPIPGVTITCTDFTLGGSATVALDLLPTATLLGPPFDYTLPGGSTNLRATVDLATLGTGIPNLSVNVISTNELIFDPTITDPARHCYDGLGRMGNRYVTFPTDQYQTISNSSGFYEQEQANDPTLAPIITQTQRNSVDIVDWTITIRRLQ
jgi:hypothetical protein